MLMDLINRGKVYRFLLKPVSPGRARLAIEASAKHHLEAPDAAFKTVGSAAPATPKPVPRATPAQRPVVPRPAPRAAASAQPPAAQPIPKIVVEPRPVPVEPAPAFVNDSLGDAFDGDDSSFTETMTGIFKSVGDTFAAVTGRDGDVPAVPAEMSIDGSGGEESILQNPRILGIGAAAAVVIIGLGWWLFSGSDDVSPIEQPQSGNSLVNESDPIFESSMADGSNESFDELSDAARTAASAGQIFNPPGRNAIELFLAASKLEPDNSSIAAELATVVEQALGMAESSLLAGNSSDTAAALQTVALAEPNNPRLPFLNAQLTQMQLRDFLSDSRQAIRDGRFEDAAVALKSARSLDLNDTSEIEVVAGELSASLSEQRVEDVLAKAKARLDEGKLTSPSNNNARYYYELALSNDPGNAAAVQGLSAVASRLVLQARDEIDAGRFEAAEVLLADARRLDPNSSEIASSSAALSSARDSVAQQQRASEQRATPPQQAASQAPAKTFAVEATAADEMKDEKVEITPSAVAVNAAATEAGAAEQDASQGDAGGADLGADTARQQTVVTPKIVPIAASALTRTKYVAPKYPRAAQRRGLTGWVEVEFTVDVDGSVKSVSVIASDPGVTFVSAAVNAVEKWEFEPVIENDQAVQKRATVRMMFAVQ
jgi:protein TonB